MTARTIAGLMRGAGRLICLLLAAVLVLGLPASAGRAQEDSPFAKLVGRWLGDGRLGITGGASERVKCRVTYVLVDEGHQVRQTIRCAADSGSIEVQSIVIHAAGNLSGTWKE